MAPNFDLPITGGNSRNKNIIDEMIWHQNACGLCYTLILLKEKKNVIINSWRGWAIWPTKQLWPIFIIERRVNELLINFTSVQLTFPAYK